jgi:hypothetical protein
MWIRKIILSSAMMLGLVSASSISPSHTLRARDKKCNYLTATNAAAYTNNSCCGLEFAQGSVSTCLDAGANNCTQSVEIYPPVETECDYLDGSGHCVIFNSPGDLLRCMTTRNCEWNGQVQLCTTVPGTSWDEYYSGPVATNLDCYEEESHHSDGSKR